MTNDEEQAEEEQEEQEEEQAEQEAAEGDGVSEQEKAIDDGPPIQSDISTHLESIAASFDRIANTLEQLFEFETAKANPQEREPKSVDSVEMAEQNINTSTLMAYQQMYQVFLLGKLEQLKACELTPEEFVKDIETFKKDTIKAIRAYTVIESSVN